MRESFFRSAKYPVCHWSTPFGGGAAPDTLETLQEGKNKPNNLPSLAASQLDIGGRSPYFCASLYLRSFSNLRAGRGRERARQVQGARKPPEKGDTVLVGIGTSGGRGVTSYPELLAEGAPLKRRELPRFPFGWRRGARICVASCVGSAWMLVVWLGWVGLGWVERWARAATGVQSTLANA